MSETGLAAFDTTVQKTNTWLREIMNELGLQDRQRAYLALRTTLHALRDRLPPEEAVELGAQLPMLVRGFYYEGWKPASTPVKHRHKRELEDLVDCWSCGASISPNADAAYQFSEEGFLCFECALARGGAYEADEDRWYVLPSAGDLPDERRPHAS